MKLPAGDVGWSETLWLEHITCHDLDVTLPGAPLQADRITHHASDAIPHLEQAWNKSSTDVAGRASNQYEGPVHVFHCQRHPESVFESDDLPAVRGSSRPAPWTCAAKRIYNFRQPTSMTARFASRYCAGGFQVKTAPSARNRSVRAAVSISCTAFRLSIAIFAATPAACPMIMYCGSIRSVE